MTKIIGIAGSLRAGSYNASLLRAATGLMPEDSVLEIGTIRGIPLYDGDVEAAEGVPPAVITLREQIADADGVLLVSPEYNNSMPGVLKNAIDWLSRQSANGDHTFGNRPFAVIGASPGGFGTILAQNAWLSVLRTLGTRQWFGGRLMVSRAGSVFNEAGELADDKVKAQLKQFLQGFVTYTQG
ncbi:MAG TPA: NADPH-dependent FMN reductase [Rhodocyclaceae bacterium]|nr:NADPH-dependent FMN reductase [Rhodocyclaceae bacterium]